MYVYLPVDVHYESEAVIKSFCVSICSLQVIQFNSIHPAIPTQMIRYKLK